MVDLGKKHSPVARFFAKAAAVVLGLAVLYAGGRIAYIRFWPDVLVRKARSDLASGDLRNAALTAQRAWQIRRSNVDAMRLLADISEKAGQYVALEWRKLVVDQAPSSLPDILACANTALHSGEPEVAKAMLAKAKNAADNSRYWALSASTDEYLGNLTDAEREAAEAARLDPGNKDYQLSRAAIQLKTQRLEIRDEARSTLETLSKDPQLRMAAERLLIEDSIANYDFEAARKLEERLVNQNESQFSDKLTYLVLLNRTGDERFASYLSGLQASAGVDPSNTGTLVAWMRSAGLKSQAFDWVKTLPKKVTCTEDAGPLVALCYADTGHWKELHELIKDQPWGKAEYLRHAFLARAAEKLGYEDEFNLTSNKALDEATADPRFERVLGEMALEWGWQGAAQRTLWNLIKTSGNQEYLNWALVHLYSIYAGQRDLGQLLAVTQKLSELKPDDDDIQNNFVMYSLLSQTNLLTVFPLADVLYKRHPTNRSFVSTYAYSLLVRGDAGAAEKIIMSLPEEDRRSTSIAPYCGIILAANGNKEMAKVYLGLVDPNKLLPEEIALVTAARNQTR